ncbi:hypothetical protein Ancab_031092 [Ancistrocladus abbreviatus]
MTATSSSNARKESSNARPRTPDSSSADGAVVENRSVKTLKRISSVAVQKNVQFKIQEVFRKIRGKRNAAFPELETNKADTSLLPILTSHYSAGNESKYRAPCIQVSMIVKIA